MSYDTVIDVPLWVSSKIKDDDLLEWRDYEGEIEWYINGERVSPPPDPIGLVEAKVNDNPDGTMTVELPGTGWS